MQRNSQRRQRLSMTNWQRTLIVSRLEIRALAGNLVSKAQNQLPSTRKTFSENCKPQTRTTPARSKRHRLIGKSLWQQHAHKLSLAY